MPVLLRYVLADGVAAPFQCEIKQPEQLVGVSGDNVLGIRVQRVRDRDRDGHVLAFVRKIPRWLTCLSLVLVRLEVVNNGVRVCLVPLWRAPVMPPGAGQLVLPSFNNCVAIAPEEIGNALRLLVGGLSCDFTPIAGFCNYLGPFFGAWEAIGTPVPITAVVVKDGFAFWMISINLVAKNGSLTPVTTSLVVNVDAPLLCLVLQPANCLNTETAVGIKSLFENRLRRKDPIAGTVELGLPARACLVTLFMSVIKKACSP